MKNTTLTVTFNTEKLDALNFHMGKRDASLQDELNDTVQRLYEKYVPADTREYLDSRNKPAVRPRPRRTAKGGRTAQTQDNNIDQDNPGQDVSTGYDMGGRHDEKV